MRLIPWLLLFPLVALAQPDPSPLTPGTFDLTVTEADGTERIVDGWAAVHAYPAALGGWTLVLDDGEDLVAIERATAPDLDGAAFTGNVVHLAVLSIGPMEGVFAIGEKLT